jgi:hypothetical protein
VHGRLGRDRLGHRPQALRPVDRERHVLPARREDLLVEELVARVGREGAEVEVLGLQRRQYPDHHQVRADAARGLLGAVQHRPHLVFELGERGARQRARRHVDLDVELAELGLEVRVGDRGEYLLVAHHRVAVLVDEVELDLAADRLARRVEAGLAQHACEHVQAVADLLAVAGAVGAGEGARFDVVAHSSPPGSFGSGILDRRGGPAIVLR